MTESDTHLTKWPRAGTRKIRTVMKEFMDLMVDGLTVPVTDGGHQYDLIVVGGGAAGLVAAMKAAGAGMDTLLIERTDADETGGAVQCFRCCPDVPGHLKDLKPGKTTTTETKCFNLALLVGKAVTGIRAEERLNVVDTEGGSEYRAKAILLSPGASSRRLNVPGEENFIGFGLHQCAACEGPAYAGQEIIVVGSAEFGIEEALSLAEYASKVTIVEPRDHLMCSKELSELAGNHQRVEVKLKSKVLALKGNGRLTSVTIQILPSGNIERLPTAAVFVFEGADPNTEFMRGVVELDPWGFITTNRDFQTSLEGVYVAGDARSGNAPGAKEPVEEGAAAVSAIQRFLEEKKLHPD